MTFPATAASSWSRVSPVTRTARSSAAISAINPSSRWPDPMYSCPQRSAFLREASIERFVCSAGRGLTRSFSAAVASSASWMDRRREIWSAPHACSALAATPLPSAQDGNQQVLRKDLVRACCFGFFLRVRECPLRKLGERSNDGLTALAPCGGPVSRLARWPSSRMRAVVYDSLVLSIRCLTSLLKSLSLGKGRGRRSRDSVLRVCHPLPPSQGPLGRPLGRFGVDVRRLLSLAAATVAVKSPVFALALERRVGPRPPLLLNHAFSHGSSADPPGSIGLPCARTMSGIFGKAGSASISRSLVSKSESSVATSCCFSSAKRPGGRCAFITPGSPTKDESISTTPAVSRG